MEFKLSRRNLLLSTAALGGTCLLSPSVFSRESGKGKPNVIFILADDLGYADLSCYGRRDYETPVLDQLASEGVKFTEGYSNSSVCSPTRVALITGRYQDRYDVGLEQPIREGVGVGLPPSAQTMPAMFKQLGYHTSLIGKWHLGELPTYGPLKSGYDSFFGFYGGGTDYFLYSQMGKGRAVFDNHTRVESDEYLTHLLSDYAIQEIQSHAKLDSPFFMSLHYNAPHWPWQGPDDRSSASADPKHLGGLDSGSILVYARMVQSMDRHIGRVLDALSSTGLDRNTIVVFTSDNGGERFSDMWPFVGMKTELFEGGIRVPAIIRWPGRIAPGSVSEQVITSMDFMPTLLSAAGFDRLDAIDLDGADLLPVLLGQSEALPRKLFWRYNNRSQQAVRYDRWKYLAIDGKEYLFDLKTDQRERANLKNKHPDRVQQLKKAFSEWEAQMLPYPENAFSHSILDIL